jgi:hypothetical protein
MAGITSTIYGSADGSAAGLGIIGELQESTVVAALGGAFTIGQFGNITSIFLTPGDWWVTGLVNAIFLTSLTRIQCAISVFTGNTTTDHVTGVNVLDCPLGVTGTLSGSISIANWTVNITTGATYFLKAQLGAAVGNILTGRLSARRMR